MEQLEKCTDVESESCVLVHGAISGCSSSLLVVTLHLAAGVSEQDEIDDEMKLRLLEFIHRSSVHKSVR